MLAHQIEELRGQGHDLLNAVRLSLANVRGAFSLAVVDANEPNTIDAARRVSPLIVAVAPGMTYLASDIPAIFDRATSFYGVDDDQVVQLTPEGFHAVNLEGVSVQLSPLTVDWD